MSMHNGALRLVILPSFQQQEQSLESPTGCNLGGERAQISVNRMVLGLGHIELASLVVYRHCRTRAMQGRVSPCP